MHTEIKLTRPHTPWQWLKLYRLYRSAFPRCERKPFSMIYKMTRLGKSDTWYCTDRGKFIGLAITINGSEHILLDYFAMAKHSRGTGYGSSVLKALIAQYAPKTLFGEIETVFDEGEDLDTRIRRKAFYLRNGLKEMGVMVYLFGVKMELLTSDQSMTFEEYRSFYEHNYSPWAADHILPTEHPYETGGEA